LGRGFGFCRDVGGGCRFGGRGHDACSKQKSPQSVLRGGECYLSVGGMASASRTVTARNDRLVTLRIAVTRAPAAPRGNALLAFTVGAVRVGALAEHRRPGRAALDPRGPAGPDG